MSLVKASKVRMLHSTLEITPTCSDRNKKAEENLNGTFKIIEGIESI